MLEVKLKELLAKNNMTIAELSEKIVTNRASLTQLANGESKMVKFETLDKIISAFDINDLSELFKIVNSGKIVANLDSQDGPYKFTVRFNIHFEPIRGEGFNHELPITFSLSKLKEGSYILQGTPQEKVSNHVQGAFSWIENNEILEFINDFWDQLLLPPTGYSPILDLSELDEFIEMKEGSEIQVFFVVKDLPWLSKLIDIQYYNIRFLASVYPDERIRGHIAKTPLIEKSKNEVLLISDLYNYFDAF